MRRIIESPLKMKVVKQRQSIFLFIDCCAHRYANEEYSGSQLESILAMCWVRSIRPHSNNRRQTIVEYVLVLAVVAVL
jgi:hypothetical protein